MDLITASELAAALLTAEQAAVAAGTIGPGARAAAGALDRLQRSIDLGLRDGSV